MSTEENVGCEECGGHGWLHMSEPFEIERCDNCSPKGWDDLKAAKKHREDCGCDWPEVDYQNMVARSSFFGWREVVPKLLEVMNEFWSVAKDRKNFVSNLPKMMEILGRAHETYWECADEQEAKYPFREKLSFLASTLVVITSMRARGQLPDHWFWYLEEGKISGEKWKAERTIPRRYPDLIQGSHADISVPHEVVAGIAALHQKLRDLGVTVTMVHDETLYDVPDGRQKEAEELIKAIGTLQLEVVLRRFVGAEPLPLFPTQPVGQSWDDLEKPFEYKAVYRALKAASGKEAGDDFEIAMAKKLILRSFPDADT